jgi:DNA-binding transcriptional ArsR family regulator
MTLLEEPTVDEMDLTIVLQALGDPVRLRIVQTLAAEPHGERTCGTFELGVSKATRSHHFRVLREAGVIIQREDGRKRLNELRREDMDARFPGLLDTVVSSG